MDKLTEFKAVMDLYGIFFNNIVPTGAVRVINPELLISTYNPEHDVLLLNQKKEKGKFLYTEFLKKYFYNVLNIPKDLKKYFFPVLAKDYDHDTNRAHLTFATISGVLMVTNCMLQNTKYNAYYGEEFGRIREYNEIVNKGIEAVNTVLDDIKKYVNGDQSDSVKKTVYGLTAWYLKDHGHPMFKTNVIMLTPQMCEAKLPEVIDYLNELKSLYGRLKIYKEQLKFDKEMTEEFKSCFDIMGLYLIMAKSVVDNAKETGAYDDLDEVKSYILNVDLDRLDRYTPNIKYYTTDKKVKSDSRGIAQYSYNQLKCEFNKFMREHPDIPMTELTISEIKANNLGENLEKSKEYIETKITQEQLNILASDWEIIKSGEGESRVPGLYTRSNTPGNKKISAITTEMREEFFESSGYKYKIKGINKFDGYQGYIYTNGLVVFEVLNDAKCNRTYIMNIDNFIELSKLTKPEISDYINSTETPDVIRKNHTSKWEDNIKKIVFGEGYTDDINGRINEIIAEGKLKKEKKEKKNV